MLPTLTVGSHLTTAAREVRPSGSWLLSFDLFFEDDLKIVKNGTLLIGTDPVHIDV